MTVRELACRELVEIVTDYLEGVMPESERMLFEEHLAECEGCVAYFDQMRRTIEMTGRLTEFDVPQPGADELLRVFRDWKSG
jgi:predicted anti-sigma-YlaC factor YlaD